MGKSKKNRKVDRNEPSGLPSVRRVSENVEVMELAVEPSSYSVANVIESLQSICPDERECGCAMLSNLVSQGGCVQQLLSSQIVKIVGPLMNDASLSTSQHAVGALRNMSIEDGTQVVTEMVRQDVMTPLIALLQQYFSSTQPSEEKKKLEDLKEGIFLQAVHLLWNLCENSEISVGIVTKQKLAPLLLSRLGVDTCSPETMVAIAQCLFTLTDNNAELVSQISEPEFLKQLETMIGTEHTSDELLLLRVLATGIFYNLSLGKLVSGHGDILNAIVKILSLTLEQDTSSRLTKIIEIIAQDNTADGRVDVEENPPDISDPTLTKNDLLDAEIRNVKHLLSAQSLAVELTANLCCPEDEGEEWEDLEDSAEDSSSLEETTDEAAAAGDLPNLCVPTDVHSSFIANQIVAKVLSKSYPAEPKISDALSSHKRGKELLPSMRSLQCRSLLCISNMVNAMETSSLGGVEQLREIWTALSQLSTTQAVIQEETYLDAVTSAMRAVAQKLIDSGSNMFSAVTAPDLQFLFEMGLKCQNANVRANAIRIVSAIGCSLAQNLQPHPLLKDIGIFLLDSCCKDNQLWVVAEALDAIFDVFAEDHLDSVVKEISLVDKLKALAPPLKQKIKSEKKSLGEHLPIISTARANLMRFIKYKQTH